MNPAFDVTGRHRAVWPDRVPARLPRCDATLWDNFDVTCRRYPEKDALRFFGLGLSFSELRVQSLRIAGWLHHEAGVRPGDRVLLILQNCPQFVIAFMAALRLGAVVVPVNPMSRSIELAHYISDSGGRVAIIAADMAPHVEAAQSRLAVTQRLAQCLVVRYVDCMPDSVEPLERGPDTWNDWLYAQPDGLANATLWSEAQGYPPLPEYAGRADDLALIVYTSGTTGPPKGCMHTHRTVGHNVSAGPLWNGMSAADVGLTVVPAFHITGLQSGVNIPLYTGATMVVMPRWDRDLARRLIARHRVTIWGNIPTMVVDLLASPGLEASELASLRYIGGGGAAMPAAVAERLHQLTGLRYVEGYGLTETAAPSHTNPPATPRGQCLGIPYIGVDSRVIDPDTLDELPPGDTGEIVIHGPQVFVGYWQRPEDTAAAFVQLDGRAFFRSGDLGRVDEQGFFTLADRLKRMINASGFKVWPAEVENLLYAHPAIQEACVIAAHDEYRGETVKAVVVLRPEFRHRIDAQEIERWSRERMAAFKVPRQVEFVDALPRSGSGKILWRELQERERAMREGSRAGH